MRGGNANIHHRKMRHKCKKGENSHKLARNRENRKKNTQKQRICAPRVGPLRRAEGGSTSLVIYARGQLHRKPSQKNKKNAASWSQPSVDRESKLELVKKSAPWQGSQRPALACPVGMHPEGGVKTWAWQNLSLTTALRSTTDSRKNK